ncbi:MAG TPA: hypothetical protein VGF56_10465 [Rhizomicrobium sp.]|jgi:hypothetical protein
MDELLAFVRGEADPARFSHREHLRMGFEMLLRHDFAQTAHLYSRTLRTMAPQAFHQTITIAQLALIAERMTGEGGFDAFLAANSDLLEKSTLSRWYRPQRLASNAARRSFLLPEPAL